MMKSGKPLPDFRRGQVLKADQLATMTSMIGGVIRTNEFGTITPLRMQVKLKDAIGPAIATLTSPASGKAWICRKDTSGNLVVTTEEITIVNRFRSHSHAANTFAKVEWIDDEYQIYAVECPGYTI